MFNDNRLIIGLIVSSVITIIGALIYIYTDFKVFGTAIAIIGIIGFFITKLLYFGDD